MTYSNLKEPAKLEREIGLVGAISANVLNMVGVGPFLTIPLALAAMGGPQAMIGWVLGAMLCLCDGMVWAELGSALPSSGGSYTYLLEGFGARGFGLPMSFLFLWQTLLTGPISIATGAVGFSQYMGFITPRMTAHQAILLAVGVCLLNTFLLYRNIRSIDRIAILMTAIVLITCGWIIESGALHFHAARAFSFPAGAFHMTRGFWMGLGATTLIAVYDYGGYNNVCLLGGEVRHPRRNIPRAVLLSICLVALIYLLMNVSMLGVLDWRVAQHSKAIAADYMQLIYGHWAGLLVSVLILVVSFGGVFANMLGYSRVPYAAAVDGRFFSIFGRLHAKGKFPTTSLLFMGGVSTIACLFSLNDLIQVLIVVQAMFQFAAQCIALVLLRKRGGEASEAYRMPLYPLPAMIALLGWIYIVLSSGARNISIGLVMAAFGFGVYFIKAKYGREWPFETI
jgi:amino acid transporter